MFDESITGVQYNTYDTLTTIEDRIIYYLLSPNNKNEVELEYVHTLWKLLYYSDCDALNKPLPAYQDVIKLISKGDVDQSKYRIFRSPKLDDGWLEMCSLLKVYLNTIVPSNNIVGFATISVDIISHTKLINLNVPEDQEMQPVDFIDDVPIYIQTMSRVSVMAQAIIGLLANADITGVGKIFFDKRKSIDIRGDYGIWNNKNFEGLRVIFGVNISTPKG